VAESKTCPLQVNTMIELQNITTTSDNNGIWLSVLALLDVIFVRSITVLTPNGNFRFVPLLHSVSDTNFGLISS
jgi:hypothetical protein